MAGLSGNSTLPADEPNMGKPQFASHAWLEPIIVLSIMIGSLIMNRRRGFRIIETRRGRSPTRSLLPHLHDHSPDSSSPGSDALLLSTEEIGSTDRFTSKSRSCCGLTTVYTPNTSRFANNIHSRVLAKFPFLIEMFYWALNFLFYVITKKFAAMVMASGDGIWDLAENHGKEVLWAEQDSILSFLFPITEVDFQNWFLNGHTDLITFLNRIYSLVHIPGTVTFLSWYYFSAPTFTHFSTVRRTMTLGNFFAFFIFSLWPCMPPRLLPKEYGFHDTVRQANAESAFVGGAYVNQLAAMPSLHFTYAFVIGCTFIYHSNVLPYPLSYSSAIASKQGRRSPILKLLWFISGILYPLLVLTVIVATANHYFLDAVVAMCTVSFSLGINKIWYFLLPLEDLFAWCIRVHKPKPTTGDRYYTGEDARSVSRVGRFKEEDAEDA